MTDEQVERLLDAIRDLPPYVFVMIGLYAGLRREEILALQWDSVYLDAKVKYNKPEELFGVVNGAFHQASAE